MPIHRKEFPLFFSLAALIFCCVYLFTAVRCGVCQARPRRTCLLIGCGRAIAAGT